LNIAKPSFIKGISDIFIAVTHFGDNAVWDYKRFLTENRLTTVSRLDEAEDVGMRVKKALHGDSEGARDFLKFAVKLKNPQEQEFAVQYVEWAQSGVGGVFRPKGVKIDPRRSAMLQRVINTLMVWE